MTALYLRRYFLIWLCCVLTGCSLPMFYQEKTPEIRQETKLFSQGLDQYLATDDLTTLKLLPKDYPQGAWRSKAEGIIDLAEKQQELQGQLDDQQVQLKELQTQLEEANQKLLLCKSDKDFATCQKEKEALTQDNQLLESTLKRLKEVLIDTELKAN